MSGGRYVFRIICYTHHVHSTLASGGECYYFRIDGVAEVCYTTGGYTMRSFDFDVMRCLVGIQHDLDTTCVDSMNSPCATANTAIGNLRKDW